MKILITGANGFIGRALHKKLIEAGHHPLGCVRHTGDARPAPGEPAPSLSGSERYAAIGNIGPETDWSGALKDMEVVVHLASRVHVADKHATNELEKHRHVNVMGTMRLANQAVVAGVRRFVYISTVAVYGQNVDALYTEVDQPDPHDAYAISKWEAEQILRGVAARTQMEVVILRPPLVYGPEVRANFLHLMQWIVKGIPLPLASVHNQRSFIYLWNVVDAIMTCINHPKAAGETYLVSDGEEVSTPELIRRVAHALGCPARLFPFPSSLLKLGGKLCGETEKTDRLLGSSVIDSSKIGRELAWTPPHTMNDGLQDTADWYRSREIK